MISRGQVRVRLIPLKMFFGLSLSNPHCKRQPVVPAVTFVTAEGTHQYQRVDALFAESIFHGPVDVIAEAFRAMPFQRVTEHGFLPTMNLEQGFSLRIGDSHFLP
jgi:hypothetical protein